ncbi:MAG: response regulator [Proteobacteria bacterium]|nr:response regulator [Pseudomonadota bacterium]
MDKIKVLMVDDEVQFRETTSRILNRRGYLTTVAGTGEEAVAILKSDRHDVVVLDIRMPGMDGHQALAEIKRIDPDIQVIMLTGHGGEESALESLEKDAFDYLSKPCDIDRLAARIKDAYSIGRKEKQTEKRARDVMIPVEEYTTVGPESSIREGIEKLNRSFMSLISTSRLMQTGHRSILVMGGKNDLVGVLSIMDLIEGLRPAYLSAPKPSMAFSMEYSAMFWTGLFTKQARDLGKKKVGDIMSPPPPGIDENANLMEAADMLYKEESRRLVVKRGDKVIGVVREQEVFFELARIILEN